MPVRDMCGFNARLSSSQSRSTFDAELAGLATA